MRVAEELEPAMYGSLETGVGQKVLEGFVRDVGDLEGTGKRYQMGPKCFEAKLTSTVADLQQRSGDGPRARRHRVREEIDDVWARQAKWQKEKKALEKEKGDSKGCLAYLEGRLVGAEKDKRRLFAQLYSAEPLGVQGHEVPSVQGGAPREEQRGAAAADGADGGGDAAGEVAGVRAAGLGASAEEPEGGGA